MGHSRKDVEQSFEKENSKNSLLVTFYTVLCAIFWDVVHLNS